MLEEIIQNRYAVTAVILFGIGFTNLMLQQNLLRKGDRIQHHGLGRLPAAGLAGVY